MNLVRILEDMRQTLSRDNERYQVIDSQHVSDLITGYKWHFYPNGKMHVSKNDALIFDQDQLDAQSLALADHIGKMLRNHYMTEFITEHAKLYESPQNYQNPQQKAAI